MFSTTLPVGGQIDAGMVEEAPGKVEGALQARDQRTTSSDTGA